MDSWWGRCRLKPWARSRSSRSATTRRTSRSTSSSTTSGCRGEAAAGDVSDLHPTNRLAALRQDGSPRPLVRTRAEASAQPLAGAAPAAAGGGFLALLLEAGFDLRVDLGATVARALEWLVIMVVSVGSLILWLVAMRSADLGALTDIGLVSVLPWWSYLTFIPIVVAFALVLAAPRPSTWLLAAIVVVLILMLYGAVPFVEGEARFSPSWRHLGLIDYVTRHGGVD